MRTSRFLWLLVAGIAAVAHAANMAPKQEQLPRYALEVIQGVPDGVPMAINNKGDVLIWSYAAPDGRNHSYVWSAGKIIDIGSLATAAEEPTSTALKGLMTGAMASAMNDKGQVVGVSVAQNGQNRAFLWEAGKARDLGALGGKGSSAQGINNLGQVVGYYENPKGEQRAFIWDSKRGMRDLGVPTRQNSAIAINDKGQVIGYSYTTLTTFIWEKNHARELKLNPLEGFGPFEALNISLNGDLIGAVKRGGVGDFESRVFLCSKGKLTEVKNPAQYNSSAFGLTSTGLVVGNAFDTPTGQHAFAWKAGKSAILNDLLEPKSGWNVRSAVAVNEKGQIAASGILDDKKQIVLLTPVKK